MNAENYITLDIELDALQCAVLDQLGIDYQHDAEERLQIASEDLQTLRDISNHGIDGGYRGFIYYNDTVEFTEDNFDAIKESLESLYYGEDILQGLTSWGCLRSYNLSTWEIAEALYNPESEWRDQVYNALAWYAAEETAHAITDAEEIEQEEEEEEEEA